MTLSTYTGLSAGRREGEGAEQIPEEVHSLALRVEDCPLSWGPMGYSLCLEEHLEDLCVVGTGAAATHAINPGISRPGQAGFTVLCGHRGGSVSGQEGISPASKRASFGAALGKMTPALGCVLRE